MLWVWEIPDRSCLAPPPKSRKMMTRQRIECPATSGAGVQPFSALTAVRWCVYFFDGVGVLCGQSFFTYGSGPCFVSFVVLHFSA